MNMESKYALGIDYGTLSARGALVDMATGQEVCSLVYQYPHGAIDRVLPGTQQRLPQDFCLFSPVDYRQGLEYLLTNVWREAGVQPHQVCAIGLDATACSPVAVDENMVPLCLHEKWAKEPHAWPKLWKHMTAQDEADRINEVALRRGEKFLRRCGNTSSAQFFFAKLLEVYRKAPEVYKAMDRFVNVADWLVWLMTGRYCSSVCTAGYKCFWGPEGFPSREFFEEVEPGFGNVVEEKVRVEVLPNGASAGGLTQEMSQLTGLPAGIPVAASMIDAHVAVPAVGLTQGGELMMTMGTSLCHLMISREGSFVPGIFGVVQDGVIPGFYGLEAGQASVGDVYDWFVHNAAGGEAAKRAAETGESMFQILTEGALRLKPGESGLLALEWWTGNRSILNNANLSGMILGISMTTKPEEIYRALVEATAFGTRVIVDNFENHGVKVDRVVACGGLSRKSELVMQVFADVLGRDIEISNIKETTALGSAMYGMVALGKERGGYDTVEDAVRALIKPAKVIYHPQPENKPVYDQLYTMYCRLHDYFGRENDLMSQLKKIQGK
jgi:L-ribulokinase